MLLFTTFAQAAWGTAQRDYLVLLLLLGVAAVSLGLAAHRQVPVIAGAAAVGVGGLMALIHLASSSSLYVVVALLALALMVAATVLVGRRRDRTPPSASAWATWR
jgi:hypothetical protein